MSEYELEAAEIRETEDGWEITFHVPRGFITFMQHEPEPVPEWRRLVDEEAEKSNYWREHEKPVSIVLYHLSDLAALHLDVDGLINAHRALARIVAVCEAQVGDGWQADPERSIGGFPGTAWGITKALATCGGGESEPDRDDWEALAGDAAAWLRDLTEAGS